MNAQQPRPVVLVGAGHVPLNVAAHAEALVERGVRLAIRKLGDATRPATSGSFWFFAPWPMLAACIGRYLLRDFDTLGVVDGRNVAGSPALSKP